MFNSIGRRSILQIGLPLFYTGFVALAMEIQAAQPASTRKKSPSIKQVTEPKSPQTKADIEAENGFNRVLLEKKLASVVAAIEELRLKKEHQKLLSDVEEEAQELSHRKALRRLQMRKERLMAELELAQARFNKKMEQSSIAAIELERKLQLEKNKTLLLVEQKNRLQAEMDTIQMEKNRQRHLSKKPIYLKDPLRKKDQVLVLSDRLVHLELDITPWSANKAIDQIQYFNNQNSQYPIFIVIDVCLGGWAMAGLDLLQAMQASKAPVYVVVKRFAASMAALLTTLSTKSYIYPNATMLHHQPSSFLFGRSNTRKIKEAYEESYHLWKRLGGALAKKMGISLQALDKKLYEKSVHGDWEEYGDQAKKLKWADVIIQGIDDTSLSTFPDAKDYTWKKYLGIDLSLEGGDAGEREAKKSAPDAAIKRYMELNPSDFYYGYSPQTR